MGCDVKEYADGRIVAEQDGPVTIITINRADVRNALDDESALALGVAFKEFDADPTQYVAVLTGAGGAFCAGADLKALAKREPGIYLAWAGDVEGPTNPTLSKPVIAAIAGHAVAGGLGIALWCDIRIIDEDSVFGVFCRRFGVPMSDGTTVRLPRLIGMSRALDMLITGCAVKGNKALEWGLATRMAPKGKTLQAACELAHEIARFPPLAMKGDRRSVYEQQDLELYAAIAREKQLAEDAKQGEANIGASHFADGTGRHGEFSSGGASE
jgi:enoyl-CoA hydratase